MSELLRLSFHFLQRKLILPIFALILATWPWIGLGNPPFLAENLGLIFRGAAPHPCRFILGCKPSKPDLEVTFQWGQRDYVICDKARTEYRGHLIWLNLNRNSVHRHYEKNQWQNQGSHGGDHRSDRTALILLIPRCQDGNWYIHSGLAS